MPLLSNIHTHTTFSDGRNSAEDMVQRALSLGFHTLGFSEHGCADYDDAAMPAEVEPEYRAEVRRLKDNASDAFLEVVTPTDIPALLRRIPKSKALITTGQKAAEVVAAAFGCGVPAVGESLLLEIGEDGIVMHGSKTAVMPGTDRASRTLRFWRMPSSSRAYPLALEKKAEAYRRLFTASGCGRCRRGILRDSG